jgi:uncharacterized Ntn-hydrolase superfamily protein
LNFGTFSITARCHKSGKLGIAISTGVPAVGALCTYIQNGVGAISSQSYVNPYLGIWGLDYLKAGHSAREAMDLLKDRDPGIEFRQIGIVDNNGNSEIFTGNACDAEKGGIHGENYAIIGNMLSGVRTLKSMKMSFESSLNLPFEERLLESLSAGHQSGGDKRGHKSAALKIFAEQLYPELDLRVDYHVEPIIELKRLYEIAKEEIIPRVRLMPEFRPTIGKFEFHRSLLDKNGKIHEY